MENINEMEKIGERVFIDNFKDDPMYFSFPVRQNPERHVDF